LVYGLKTHLFPLHFSGRFYMARLKTEMLIYLSPTKYELFLLRTTKDSPARLTLAGAREIDTHPSSKFSNKWVIFCDRFKAAALYNVAKEVCPEAMPEIEIAFQHDRFYWM